MNLLRHYPGQIMSEHNTHQKSLIFLDLHRTIRFVAAALAIVAVSTTLSLNTMMSEHLNSGNLTANFATPSAELVRSNKKRKARTLVGVFTSVGGKFDEEYRRLFRELYAAHPKVCSLANFKNRSKFERESCELVYTFVVGGNTDPRGPTELVDDSIPLTVPSPSENVKPGDQPDLSNPDVTFLNIRENMNKGKSQTWFYFAGKEAKEYKFDYVAKQDTDALPYLDQFFDFVDNALPPHPYNSRTLVGTFVDKQIHWQLWKEKRKPNEDFFWTNYNGLHLYVEGQFYMMSSDLCATVAKVGSKGLGVAAEGHEGHDVSTMAFMGMDKYPMRLVLIPKSEHPSRFWKHGIKLKRLGWARTQSYFETETKRITDPSLPHYVDPYSPEEMRKAKMKQKLQSSA